MSRKSQSPSPHSGPSPLSNPSPSPSSHRRRSSIVDFLSAPPPPTDRRLSTQSSSSSVVDDDTIAYTDWFDIPLSELVQQDKVVYVEHDASVQQAFEVLDSHGFTSIPVKTAPGSSTISTFDYADLTTYLLLVLGHIEPVSQSQEIESMIVKARQGEPVPVGPFVMELGAKDPFVTVRPEATLGVAAEILGSGVHRIAVIAADGELVGILSQRRLVRYVWENGRLFPSLQDLFQSPIRDLSIGATKKVISVNGDEQVITALVRMHTEGVSSLAVVDTHNDLLGNISIVDVRLLTSTAQSKYLKYSCKQFLTVILSNRGLIDGKDSFPVFHVTQDSTMGRTIAKIVATNAHRLWVVSGNNPSSSPSSSSSSNSSAVPSNAAVSPTIPTASLSSPTIGGHLESVVSLTDIIHVFARRSGREQLDPNSARKARRRSSSSSVRPTRLF